MKRLGAVPAVLAVVALTGCSVAGPGSLDIPAPAQERAPEWQKVAPAAVGMDAAALERLADRARRGASRCLIVARDGKLAGEWYFERGPDQPQETFSVTKSVANILVGIAQDDGHLRIDDPAAKWITEWRGTPAAAVTVRDLLSNDSGRYWSTTTDYNGLVFARDRTQYAIRLGQAHPPGKVWAYNNAAIQTLERVLRKATGQRVEEFAQQRLFGPLGMTNTRLTPDRSGNATLYAGMRSTCRDLARLGLLMQNQGRVDGKQIVSSEWVKESTGRSSTELNAAYGHLWWLNKRGRVAGPFAVSQRNSIAPAAPDRLFWALGLGNQIVQVDPGTRTIVVRLGPERPPRPPTFGPADASEVIKAVLR